MRTCFGTRHHQFRHHERLHDEVVRASIVLSPKEIALLEYSLRTPGAPLPRTNFVEEVWRMQGVSLTNVIDVYIYYLRRKIDAGSDRPLIRTIRGVGYQIGGNQLSSQAVDHYP